MIARTGEVRASFSWTPLGRSRPTVAGLDLRIEPGERVLLVGRSGSGKSTTLHALLGALGHSVPGELEGEIAVGGHVGFVPQNPQDAVVAERIGRDVAFGPENLGLARGEIWDRVDEALSAVGLSYSREHLTAALSGGEQQRLALAGVLALRPDVLLLDEPTSMLDAETGAQVRAAVMDVVGHRTLVVVEHRFEPWLEHVDRVVVLDAGAVVSDTTPDRVPVMPGLWSPGAPAPVPMELPAGLVRPDGPVATVDFDDVTVDVVTRALRGSDVTRVLNSLTTRCRAGQVTAFTGRSGSGKSTALLTAAGLLRPVSGTVTPDRTRLRSRALARDLGWVPQNPEHAFVARSVRDEVVATSRRVGREIDVESVIEAAGLSGYEDAHPYRLSGGEQRRLAMAAGLAHRPGLVVLDEPTVGQDPENWALVAGWCAAFAREGATVALSTHDPHLRRDAEVAL